MITLTSGDSNGKYLVAAGVLLGAASVGAVWLSRRKKKLRFGMLDELHKPWVHIKDRARVQKVIANMAAEGPDKLQVITDFDRTLSGYRRNGSLVNTCHQALDNADVLPKDYRQRAWAVRNKYYPMEINPNLTMEEKIPLMVEWWTTANNLLVSCGITKKMLTDIVGNSNIVLREGCDWLFKELSVQGVPLLIFSAGVGDIIEECIRQRHVMYSNMKVVSNYMDFDEQGVIRGFKGELIHTFNKNKAAIQKSDYFQRLRQRHNLILLGDSMGDLNMAEGAHNLANTLKIGFLNDKIDERLSQYIDAYDVVLVGDETMDVPNAILRHIL